MAQTINPWDEIFQKKGLVFVEPQEDVPSIVALLRDRGGSTVLDLGCGSGRHVVYLARRGFSVFGLDSAPSALDLTRQWLADERLTADLRLGNMADPLPYADGFFDAVISVQVIHHARIAVIRQIVAEMRRVLKPGGYIFVTVLRGDTPQWTDAREIEPGTFIPLDGREKGLPHHLFTSDELRELFAGMAAVETHPDETGHWCLSAFAPPAGFKPAGG